LFTITHRIFQITEFDACPRKPCNNGYYPIHEAAKNASSKTMEVFFQASYPFHFPIRTCPSCMLQLRVCHLIQLWSYCGSYPHWTL